MIDLGARGKGRDTLVPKLHLGTFSVPAKFYFAQTSATKLPGHAALPSAAWERGEIFFSKSVILSLSKDQRPENDRDRKRPVS
jgi:hypothetical protein